MKKILLAVTILALPMAINARKMEYSFGEKEGQPILTQDDRIEGMTREQLEISKKILEEQQASNKLLQQLIEAVKSQQESNERAIIKLAQYIKAVEEKTELEKKKPTESDQPIE